jgi:small subunit ribosomal protein S21
LVSVVLRNGENQQQLAKRFRKKVVRSGLLGEVRKRRWFISRSEQRRIDKKKSIRRQIKNEKKRSYGGYRRR